jgi:hypothetical protein
MDGSESIMQHWDHLHTLLGALALLFAYLALRASKKVKFMRIASNDSDGLKPIAVKSPSSQLAQVIPINSAATATHLAATQKTQSSSDRPEDHAEIAQLLTLMQQHARLLDFVSEDITHFSDQQVGAVARVLHGGLKKVLSDSVRYAPILTANEQENVQVAVGFDHQRIRLQGQIHHNGPYQGQLIHGGWQLTAVMLPKRGADYQASILQAAEVEV